VQIFEVGDQQGLPYFSLEYVDGGSLAELLNATPLPALEAAHLVEILARAMHAAHQRGVIHRDLKPANILLAGARGLKTEKVSALTVSFRSPGMVPKITDFGLAKRLDAQTRHTQTGAIMGTPSYMAPEQAKAQPDEIGPAADIYALGAILYELATGRPPFKAATPLDTVLQVVADEPVSPRRLQGTVPRDLETICLKCLHKDPKRRYLTSAELADDLSRFLAGKPILARPVSAMERGWRWCRRNPALAGLLAAVVVSLLAGSGIAALFAIQADARAREARWEKERANAEAAEAEKYAAAARQEKRNYRQQLYVAHMSLADRAWENVAVDHLLDLLDAQRPGSTGGEDFRSFEWYYWDRLCHNDLQTLEHSDSVESIAFSPDGKHLASTCGENAVHLWDVASGKEVRKYNLAVSLALIVRNSLAYNLLSVIASR
jgi:hypothetical protein